MLEARLEPNKKEILDSLSKLMDKYPDMRLGQLVVNVAYWAVGPSAGAVWDVENDEWVAAAKEKLKE